MPRYVSSLLDFKQSIQDLNVPPKSDPFPAEQYPNASSPPASSASKSPARIASSSGSHAQLIIHGELITLSSSPNP